MAATASVLTAGRELRGLGKSVARDRELLRKLLRLPGLVCHNGAFQRRSGPPREQIRLLIRPALHQAFDVRLTFRHASHVVAQEPGENVLANQRVNSETGVGQKCVRRLRSGRNDDDEQHDGGSENSHINLLRGGHTLSSRPEGVM